MSKSIRIRGEEGGGEVFNRLFFGAKRQSIAETIIKKKLDQDRRGWGGVPKKSCAYSRGRVCVYV